MNDSAQRRPLEILLVDDSPSDRLLTLEGLAAYDQGSAVTAVDNGADALDYVYGRGKFAGARRPDLVLLDLNLPRNDGREVLSEIKADPVLRTIPIVVLTTSDADADVAHAYQNHANAYLRKPIEFSRFAQALHALGDFWLKAVTLPQEVAPGSAPARLPSVEHLRLLPGDEVVRVLLIEDSATDALLIRDALATSGTVRFDVQHVERLREAAPLLKRGGFDLVMTDLGLPDSQGLDTVREIRQLGVDAPLVVLTGLDDEELGVQALRDGAHDYLVKGQLTPRAIARAARYAIDKREHQEQLRQAQKLEAVGRLAAGIAHDFNNVLSIVRGNAELVGETRDLAEARASAHEIQEATDRAMALARQLLAFSRQQAMHAKPTDLNRVVLGFSRMLERLIGTAIRLELRLAPTLPYVLGDAGMLEQVLLNLAVNARDAMPAGGRLSIESSVVDLDARDRSAATSAPTRRFVRMAVQDTGHGMSPEVRARIFEPFFTTKSRGQGTGLGLATVHGIVQQHRGFMNVTSQVNEGTTFEVFLPTTDSQPERSGFALSRPTAELTEKILVVEDESVLRKLCARVLAREGYEVLTAASAAEARALWSEHGARIQLLLTDLVLPDGETGRKLAASLQATAPELEIIFMSGYSPDYTSRDFVLEHGVNFLQKPFTFRDMLQCIRRKLDAAARK